MNQSDLQQLQNLQGKHILLADDDAEFLTTAHWSFSICTSALGIQYPLNSE